MDKYQIYILNFVIIDCKSCASFDKSLLDFEISSMDAEASSVDAEFSYATAAFKASKLVCSAIEAITVLACPILLVLSLVYRCVSSI